jgi:hypothetical protein
MSGSDDRGQGQGAAIFQLYRMYDLAPVIWGNLRPEQADPVHVGREGARQIHDERQRKKVCDRLSYRIVEVKAGIRLTDKGEEYALELPADVDPVTMVGNDREELLPVEEPSSDTKRAARTRRKPSRGAN